MVKPAKQDAFHKESIRATVLPRDGCLSRKKKFIDKMGYGSWKRDSDLFFGR
jgi:hypothetical protein